MRGYPGDATAKESSRAVGEGTAFGEAFPTELAALLAQRAPLPRAVLAAARVAARAWVQADPEMTPALPPWIRLLSGDASPRPEDLQALWQILSGLQPDAPRRLSPEDAEAIRALWPLLDLADRIMETGGDIRLQCDPASGLNGYGCSHRPRPWVITFASSTASSVSERGFEAADERRRAVTAALLRTGGREAIFSELREVRRAIKACFGMKVDEKVVLAASGTDSELLSLALAHLAKPDLPLLNILLAPEETGSGVPMAAAGRHFAIDTANGHEVERQSLIAGFRADTALRDIGLRGPDGAALPNAVVAASIIEAVDRGIDEGRRVILHALDLSKTGLLAPGIALLRELRARFGDRLDIVVDACQTRLAPARVRDYLALDAVVQITGSKFFTGPPFAGAALLPARIAVRLDDGVLPSGLDAYFGRGEWPEAPAARHLPDTANYGLALRWRAALAEMQAFAAEPDERKCAILDRFAEAVAKAMRDHPEFLPWPAPRLDRGSGGWDCRRTVFAFAIRAPFAPDRFLTLDETRKVYQWLNADCSVLFETADEQRRASRICHIGQPVALPDGKGGRLGLLRVSAGARLVSGEPSHHALHGERRLDREMADLAAVFDKIALLRTAWPRLARADPKPRYLR